MNILFYRYGSICEPDILEAFQKMKLHVLEEKTEITKKRLSDSERVTNVESILKKEHPLFVFSINFYPAIAKICNIYKTPYLFWTVDSPVPELFDTAIALNTNRIFLFDLAQYNDFAPYNPEHTYHLPLAAATDRFDQVTSRIAEADRSKYSHDIAFVGSLYTEKDPLQDMHMLTNYVRGFIQGITESSLKLFGYYPAPDALTEPVIQALKTAYPDFYRPAAPITDTDRYVAAHSYIGYHAAATERTRTLNTLSEYFSVNLYTLSQTEKLNKKICTHRGAQTLTEMPKIFHLSKINLNMTIKPIRTGLPLRIFDILGCGGFCMTNYQAELEDYFEIGTDLEAYSSIEELIDKCAYYLSHEEERQAIAQNGYEKVKAGHTYFHRMKSMISVLTE